MSSDPHILLVDDDQVMVELYEEVLMSEGYKVRSALGGQKAFEILQSPFPVSVVFLDCLMPQMSGDEFITEFEARFPEHFKQTRIIGFSSLGPRSPQAKDLEGRIAAFVEKPQDIDTFLEVVRKYAGAPRATT